ncbi:hypothetical protein D3C86_1258080 [compost metagenome]
MHLHASAHAPHLAHIGVAQHPVAFHLVANIHHAAGLRLQALCCVVGQLGQGLRGRDADSHRDAGAAQYFATDLAAERVQAFYARQIGERLVNAIHLHRRHHRFNQSHYSLTHVAVECVIGRKRNDAVLPQLVFDLKIWLAHFHEGLGIIAARDNTAVIVGQDHYRHLCQVWAEHPFAAGVKAVAIDQAKHWQRLRHGCARYW